MKFSQEGVVARRSRAVLRVIFQEKHHLLPLVIRGPLEHLEIVAQDQQYGQLSNQKIVDEGGAYKRGFDRMSINLFQIYF